MEGFSIEDRECTESFADLYGMEYSEFTDKNSYDEDTDELIPGMEDFCNKIRIYKYLVTGTWTKNDNGSISRVIEIVEGYGADLGLLKNAISLIEEIDKVIRNAPSSL